MTHNLEVLCPLTSIWELSWGPCNEGGYTFTSPAPVSHVSIHLVPVAERMDSVFEVALGKALSTGSYADGIHSYCWLWYISKHTHYHELYLSLSCVIDRHSLPVRSRMPREESIFPDVAYNGEKQKRRKFMGI